MRLVPNRRWAQFSLRGLLLVTTLLAIWLGRTVDSANKQRQAVPSIVAAGGHVRYDYEAPDPMRPMKPVKVSWLARAFGVDLFHNVVRVSFPNGRAGSAQLASLAGLPRLEELSIEDPTLIVDDFVHLRRLRRLRTIGLYGVRSGTGGLEHLTAVPSLESIYLSGPGVTDESLRIIGQIASLRHLELWGARIGDEGVRHLAGLRNLRRLQLLGTSVGDGAIPNLTGLSKLEHLSLRGASISDLSVAPLAQLRQLKSLSIRDTRVSDRGVARLKSANPGLKVIR